MYILILLKTNFFGRLALQFGEEATATTASTDTRSSIMVDDDDELDDITPTPSPVSSPTTRRASPRLAAGRRKTKAPATQRSAAASRPRVVPRALSNRPAVLKRRGRKYTDEEISFLLDTCQDMLQIGGEEWEAVSQTHNEAYPNHGRDQLSL